MNSSNECKKYLAAFADGELDVDQNLRLLERMKMDPNATARVTHQQQLRENVCRCMSADCPPMPDALKQSVMQMLEEPSIDEHEAVIARIRPYQVTAFLSSIAAAIAICLSLFMYFNQPNVTPGFEYSQVANEEHIPGFNDYTAASILPASQIDRFSNRHTSCAQKISILHQFASNPTSVEEMPKVISEHLGKQAYPCLNLSNIGYEFAAAGPCKIPNKNASAHLVYKSTNPDGKQDTISLWIAPDDGTLDLVPDKAFRIRGPESSHPIIAWRHNNLVYYIVGDTYTNVQRAYVALNGTTTSGA
ncbi:MAG TPA: hypothetical protein DCM28_19165 [Phycisphaerales bacterium]|nr:hypothetical protein [Phycisphaerales bacterium]HCD34229.1 hypothetical protein [Phycisphaerales bacterium]|tara:strand:+ start:42371 stop:43282 length:912 start_codon:yes stop_codon:yes gene_type:complete